ncbi:hypothetical protein Tco_1361890 [Tanacetum coccineum]
MKSQSKTTQTVSALKLLIGVIVNGDAPAAIASASAGTEGPIPPKTAKQKLARKNELKAKSTLLLAILDEHLLKFHGIRMQRTYGNQSRPDGSQMASGHAYHEGEKILKEDRKESEFQWQRNCRL